MQEKYENEKHVTQSELLLLITCHQTEIQVKLYKQSYMWSIHVNHTYTYNLGTCADIPEALF